METRHEAMRPAMTREEPALPSPMALLPASVAPRRPGPPGRATGGQGGASGWVGRVDARWASPGWVWAAGSQGPAGRAIHTL